MATDALNDRAADVWESLRLMSFHGAPWDRDVMVADMTQEHVTDVERLVNELAADRRRLREALERIARLEPERGYNGARRIATTALGPEETGEARPRPSKGPEASK